MKADRFLVLDSLRGICAIMVALYHFPTTGTISNLQIIRNSWLFVDFFFVLSGFVIAAAYRRRLSEGVSPRLFMWNRFWRLYPLHITILCLLLLGEILLAVGLVPATREAFGTGRTGKEFFYAATFLNCFGLTGELGWNGPSWSIGAEWWVYVVFAMIEVTTRARANIMWLIVVGMALALSVSSGVVDRTFDFGVLRAILGFGIGTLTFSLYSKYPLQLGKLESYIEAFLIVLVIFVVIATPASLQVAVPLMFAAVVYTFASSDGTCSKILQKPFLLKLGALSYSIYLWQVFLQARFLDVVGFVLPQYVARSDSSRPVLIGPSLIGDALTLTMLTILILASALSYKWIEVPGQRLGKKRASRASMRALEGR